MSKRKPHDESPDSGQPTFEESVAALEKIVGELEDGELGLAESLARYEQGVAHLRRCYESLDQAEKKIEQLTGVDAAGNPIVAPFDATATGAENVGARSKPAARSRRAMDDDADIF